eukprot:ANDGO_04349.mRNA.1 Phosphatidylinositol transfer protein 1
MRVKEYRVVLPLTVEEYQIGQLYSVAKSSRQETSAKGDGVEILKNEPYEKTLEDGSVEKGQYTHKIYHIGNRVPGWIRAIAPKSMLKLQEDAWNAYPFCKTVLTCEYFAKKLSILVQTLHVQDAGSQENVHKLSDEMLAMREVDFIDIALDPLPEKKDYKAEEDPALFKSTKTGRGPLEKGWQQQTEKTPIMTAYKLVVAEFKQWGLQSKVEHNIVTSQRGVFLKFHKQVFTWIDEWHGLTMVDIRRMEEETKRQLDALEEKKDDDSHQDAAHSEKHA